MKPLKRIFYFFCAACQPHSSRTVRFAFPLIFTFAALLGAAATITSDTQSYIYLEASQTSVRAGESFEIDVYAHAHVAVNAVDISVSFPKEQVEIKGIDTGESVITLWAIDPYVQNNTVMLQGGTFRRGFRGDHLIATINARAVETGLAQIAVDEVTLLAGDGSGSSIPISQSGNKETTLYIADQNGLYTGAPTHGGVELQGTASIVIVTDIDGDGMVTITDVSRFMSAWASKSIIYDFNGDGYMSFRDFGIILADSFIR